MTDTWLLAVDKSGLPGKFKAWIYQHSILPCLLWPLLVYEVPITIIEGFERKISQFLRRWLGLPRSLSSTALFGHNTKLQLLLSSLEEEFKVIRAREVLLYRDSADNKVSSAGVEIRTGRKWCTQDAVEWAEGNRKINGVQPYCGSVWTETERVQLCNALTCSNGSRHPTEKEMKGCFLL
ncbi:hypothetical protein SRHO_G00247140 [Serrasalmus rhombeus]